MGFMPLVEGLKEGSRLGFAVDFMSAVVVEVINALVMHSDFGGHKVLVEVTSLCEMPLCVVEHFIANVDHPINFNCVGDVGVGSEVVAHKYFGLFWACSVPSESRGYYISCILMRYGMSLQILL